MATAADWHQQTHNWLQQNHLTDSDLKFSVVVAESHTQHIL